MVSFIRLVQNSVSVVKRRHLLDHKVCSSEVKGYRDTRPSVEKTRSVRKIDAVVKVR